MTAVRPHLLGPWRRTFQWGATLLLLIVPFVRIDGRSLLRIDLPTLSLMAFGSTFRIEELSLSLLFVAAAILFFLLATLALGRVWCGWVCPQTTLSDLADGFAGLIGMRAAGGRIEGVWWQKSVLQLFYLAIGLLFAANLVWYFISPYEFFPRMVEGELGIGTLLSLAIVGGAIWIDLAFVRRLLCREFCPYGRFQTVLVDPGTLTLRFPPEEAARCIRCSACVRACPVGIDVREGYQVECINCGRCLDACRGVMAKRGESGIIRYTFGMQGKGWKALLNLRMGLLLVAFTGVTTALVTAAVHRPEASLKLSRSPAAERQLADGRMANFFVGYAANRSTEPAQFALRAELPDGSQLEIRGPGAEILLLPGERRRIDFALLMPALPKGGSVPVVFLLQDSRGRTTARAEALVTSPQE